LVLGSELELSRNLTLKYFNESSYIEIPQKITYFTTPSMKELIKELTYKALTGYIHAKTLNPDMILVFKSNHVLSISTIIDMVEHDKLNNGVKNFYGIAFAHNKFIMTCLDSDNNISNKIGFIFGNCIDMGAREITNCFRSEYAKQQVGDACVIGIPREIYLKDKNIPEYSLYCHEITWQVELKKLGHTCYPIKNTWIFNIKSLKNDKMNHSGFHKWLQHGKKTFDKEWNDLIKREDYQEFIELFNNL